MPLTNGTRKVNFYLGFKQNLFYFVHFPTNNPNFVFYIRFDSKKINKI